MIGGGVALPLESNGGVPVNVQDQTSRIVNFFFIKMLGAETTTASIGTSGEYELDVVDATGFADGQLVGVFCPDGQFYFGQLFGAPVGNTLEFDTPFDIELPIGCTVLNATREMAVDGSVTPQVFQVGPVRGETDIEIDITRVNGQIVDNSAMDDGKFGGGAALTKGLVFRKNDGVYINYSNIKTNGDIALYCGIDLNYTDKGPAGSYGARFRSTFAGQDKRGVTIRLVPGDTLEVLVQDDLTHLISFEMLAQGHFVTN